MAAEKLDQDEIRQLLGALQAPPTVAAPPAASARQGRPWGMIALCLALAALAAFFYWRGANPGTKERASGSTSSPAAADSAANTASAASAGSRAFGGHVGGSSVLDASGYVFATRQATVSSETTGRLAHVYTEEGATVTKGQLLADIDSSNIVVQIALAEAELASARKALVSAKIQRDEAKNKIARTRKLVEKGFTSPQQLDAEQFQLDFQEAQVAARASEIEVAGKRLLIQQQQLKNTRIVAPFDGLVIEQPAQVGEIVSPISAGGGFTRTGICTLLDINSLGVQVNVSEQFIGKVRKGQAVKIRVQAYPDLTLKGEVSKIMPAASRETAAVKVQIGFVERDPRVLPNMGVNVSFQ